jgi:hypothetical protein
MADVVDAWIAWQEDGGVADDGSEALLRFVDHVCAKHNVPPAFYRAVAEAEARA